MGGSRLRPWLCADCDRDPRVLTGLATGGAFAVTLAVAALSSALPGGLPAGTALAVMTIVVALAGWLATGRAALATAGIAWLMLNGFVVDRYGQLRWHGTGDIWRIVVLLTCAAVVAGARATRLRRRRGRTAGMHSDLDLELRELTDAAHRTWGEPNA